MMLLDVQQENTQISPLIVTPSKEVQKSLSFSDLLQNIGNKSSLVLEDIKQENSLLLNEAKKDESKSTTKTNFLELLLDDTEAEEIEDELLELNPKLKSSLSKDELNKLVVEAKQFLKEKIVQSDGFKSAEIELLPKTLRGLTKVAQKLGIDISSVKLEEVLSFEEPSSVLSKKVETHSLQKSKSAVEEVVNKSTKEQQPRVTANDTIISNSNKISHSNKESLKDISIFKGGQASSEITTQQLVDSKIINKDLQKRTPKERSADTLELLLRGEKALKSQSSVATPDFSVATAKVIVSNDTNKAQQSLETLLGVDETQSDTIAEQKIETTKTPKADSFEVKLNEAKQMIKYLSQDVKSAIEDYKAPFTRVKVQLNPKKLGEIDLTIVQRGKNLHINLSSNNAAINTLSMNANDLKTQLQNSGINNASLNFSSSSQGGEHTNGGQAQQHHNQNAQDEYNYFDKQDEHEEILSSLEIVVPNYA